MADLGSFDGQVPNFAVVKVSGSVPVDRALAQDEVAYLIVKVEVGAVEFEEKHESLYRVHKAKVMAGAETSGTLLGEAIKFMDKVIAGDQVRIDFTEAGKEQPF